MLCVKTILPFLLLIFSTYLYFSHGNSQIGLQPNFHIQGIIEEGEYDVVSWEKRRRSVLDGNNVELSNNKSMILAAERTHRRNPFDHFKYYQGGWNISEKNYFYSVAYTAAPLLIIAVLWFIGYATALLIICIRHCCCHLKHFGYSRTIYALSLGFLTFFTVAEIIGCIVFYTGQEKFHQSSTSTVNYVVNQADNTVDNLTAVSEYLSAAKGVEVDQFYLPSSALNNINTVSSMINSSAATLREKTDKNSDKIQHVLHSVWVTLIVVATLMLLLAFLGFLLSIFGLEKCVYILATIGWILATMALILCCVFLIVHNVVGDTCFSIDEWIQNPTAHTALDDILPCVDEATSEKILSESKDIAFQLVAVVNSFITNVANIDPPKNLSFNLPPDAKVFYYNQSGPLVPVLCNHPTNSDMTDQNCAAGEVNFDNASQEWSKYICQVSSDGNCTTTGRLTPQFYNQMIYALNVSYALDRYGPFLANLVDCTFVRETFRGIIDHHCPGLNRYSGWIFIGFVMVSVAVMLSLIFWVFHARERRLRLHSKQFINLSAQKTIGDESGEQ